MSQIERTPKDVARQSSIFIGVMSALATITVLWLAEAFELWAVAIVIGILLEEISYFVIYNAVEKFIDHRIKVLYKTISKIKGGDEHSINMDEDIVETANQDVMEWAEDQIKEITLLRETDSFRKDFIGNLAHELKTPLFQHSGIYTNPSRGRL